jgi:hypothetical protein
LQLLQWKRPLTPVNFGHPNREINGFIEVPGGYAWRYIIFRYPQPDGTTRRDLEVGYEAADGVTTYLRTTIGGDEDATFGELRAFAGRIADFPPPVAEPTHPPYEPAAEADTWEPDSPPDCPREAPPDQVVQRFKRVGTQLANGVVFVRVPFEIDWNPGRAMLVDLSTGDYVSFDERGRRIGSGLCDAAAIERLRTVVDQAGFRSFVRSKLAKQAP